MDFSHAKNFHFTWPVMIRLEITWPESDRTSGSDMVKIFCKYLDHDQSNHRIWLNPSRVYTPVRLISKTITMEAHEYSKSEKINPIQMNIIAISYNSIFSEKVYRNSFDGIFTTKFIKKCQFGRLPYHILNLYYSALSLPLHLFK